MWGARGRVQGCHRPPRFLFQELPISSTPHSKHCCRQPRWARPLPSGATPLWFHASLSFASGLVIVGGKDRVGLCAFIPSPRVPAHPSSLCPGSQYPALQRLLKPPSPWYPWGQRSCPDLSPITSSSAQNPPGTSVSLRSKPKSPLGPHGPAGSASPLTPALFASTLLSHTVPLTLPYAHWSAPCTSTMPPGILPTQGNPKREIQLSLSP